MLGLEWMVGILGGGMGLERYDRFADDMTLV